MKRKSPFSHTFLAFLLACFGLLLSACGGESTDTTVNSVTEESALPPIPVTVKLFVAHGTVITGGSFQTMTADPNNLVLPDNLDFVQTTLSTSTHGTYDSNQSRKAGFVFITTDKWNEMNSDLAALNACPTCTLRVDIKYDNRSKTNPKPLLSPFITFTFTQQ